LIGASTNDVGFEDVVMVSADDDPGAHAGFNDLSGPRPFREPIGYRPPVEYEEVHYRCQEAPAMMAGVN